MLQRDPHNPILSPIPEHPWECFAVFNGSVIKKGEEYVMFYRAMGEEADVNGKKLRLSTIGKAQSTDGTHFTNRGQFLKPEFDWERYGCEDPRVTAIDGTYLIFYTGLSVYPPNYLGIKTAVAISDDLVTVRERHLVTPFNAKAMTMFPEKINGLFTVLLTVNTDRPPARVAIAQMEELETLWDPEFWRQWYKDLETHRVTLRRVNSDQQEIGAPPVKTRDGWLLIYSYIKHYLSQNVKKEFHIEATLLDLVDPQKIIGRVETPLLVPEETYERDGQTSDVVFPEGALIEKNLLKIYYGAADSYCALAGIELSEVMKLMEVNAPTVFKSHKFSNNPLLAPIADHPWEAKGVFNPGIVSVDGKIYILYRALSADNVSNIGLAVSEDGLHIDERLPEPIYPLHTPYEKPKKEGMGGGAEDVRLTQIDDRLYMCYTAYDGELPRLAFTSISIDEFIRRDWTRWKKPKIISPPNVMDKNGALFSEKINGKYVFFHRIEPNIVVDMVDDLEFEKRTYLRFGGIILPRTMSWDEVKIGICGPPMRTQNGWLVFYHGISRIDRHYRLGALLLNLTDPTDVIARTPYPILEPEASFEKEGIVPNVVFSCGQAVKDDDIYIYYGAADKVICGTKVSLSALLDYLLRTSKKKYLEPSA